MELAWAWALPGPEILQECSVFVPQFPKKPLTDLTESAFLHLPQEMWMVVYIILGGWLCLLGLIMLGLRFCECCCGNQPQPQNPTVGQATHVQS